MRRGGGRRVRSRARTGGDAARRRARRAALRRRRFAAKLAVVARRRASRWSRRRSAARRPTTSRRLHARGAAVWATVDVGRRGDRRSRVRRATCSSHRAPRPAATAALARRRTSRPAAARAAALRARRVDLPLVATGGIGDRAPAMPRARCRRGGRPGRHRVSPLPGGGHERAASSDAVRARRPTAITRAFTGRRARGIVNASCASIRTRRRPTRTIHYLTAPLRAAARAAGDAERINLWAGTRFATGASACPAAEVVAELRP